VQSCEFNPYEVGNIDEIEAGAEMRSSGLDVSLRFENRKGLVTGEIMSEGLSKHYVFPEAQMKGAASGENIKLRVFDWINAKPVTLATVKFRRVNEDCLSFELVDGSSSILPRKAYLTRQTKGYYQSRTREGGLMQNALRKVIENIRHDEASKSLTSK